MPVYNKLIVSVVCSLMWIYPEMITMGCCWLKPYPNPIFGPWLEKGLPGFKHLGQCCQLLFLHSIISLYCSHNSKAYHKEKLLCHLSSVIRALQWVWCHMVWEKGSQILGRSGSTEGLRLVTSSTSAVRMQVHWPLLAAGMPRLPFPSRYLGLC